MSHRVKIDLPITVVEPLFTALHNIRAADHSRLEMKAIAMLRTSLYFELEKMMETPEESEVSKTNFMNLFNRERSKRNRSNEYEQKERVK